MFARGLQRLGQSARRFNAPSTFNSTRFASNSALVNGQKPNFLNGSLTEKQTRPGQQFSRVFDNLNSASAGGKGASIDGRYWSQDDLSSQSPAEYQQNAAIQPDWNKLSYLVKGTFPEGTEYHQGKAGPQSPKNPGDLDLPGGADQEFIPETSGLSVDQLSHFDASQSADDKGLAYGGYLNSGPDLFRRDERH
jgi:hypothetical protein